MASQTLIWFSLGWGLRFCISNKLQGVVAFQAWIAMASGDANGRMGGFSPKPAKGWTWNLLAYRDLIYTSMSPSQITFFGAGIESFFFFFLTSLLEYNCFTMVRRFLLYNKANQLHMYIVFVTAPSLASKLSARPVRSTINGIWIE